MTVTVSDDARNDADRAARKYDAKPGRYGDAFLDEFAAAVRRIGANPRLLPRAEDAPPIGEWREAFIARFSQRVIFRIDGDVATVVAVVHTDAPPGYWTKFLSAP